MFASVPPRASTRPAIPAALAGRVRPLVAASSRLIPVAPALEALFPDRALRRGTTTVVRGPAGRGVRTLSLSMLSAASAAGHWCGVVGLADPGISAMAELGLDLRRVVFIPDAGGDWATAAAELFDGVDLVLVRPSGVVSHTVARHLMSKARERKSVLVVACSTPRPWPLGPELELSLCASRWRGVGGGHGHLVSREVEVEVTGRRGADRGERLSLQLPAGLGAHRVQGAS